MKYIKFETTLIGLFDKTMKFKETQEKAEYQLYLQDRIQEMLQRLIRLNKVNLISCVLVELSLEERFKQEAPPIEERIKIFEKIDDKLSKMLEVSSNTIH